MKNIISDHRGIALITVILMVSVIVVLTLDLSRSTREELYETANLSDGIKLYYMAKSGFHGGEALLTQDKNNYDALTEDWARAELFSQQSDTLFRQGSFLVSISDEIGKIPINKLVNGNAYNPQIRELLIRLLSLPEFKLEQDKIHEIVDSIKDWLDQDDVVTGAGAENAYYNNLNNPYSSKNGLMDCIDELLMVKGVTKELYYGTKESSALAEFLTVYGDGKININTAPQLVLRSFSNDISEEIAARMDEYRKTDSNNLADAYWYRKIRGLSEGSINSALLTVKSEYFTVASTGILGNMKEKVTGIVKREPALGTAMLLSWKIE